VEVRFGGNDRKRQQSGVNNRYFDVERSAIIIEILLQSRHKVLSPHPVITSRFIESNLIEGISLRNRCWSHLHSILMEKVGKLSRDLCSIHSEWKCLVREWKQIDKVALILPFVRGKVWLLKTCPQVHRQLRRIEYFLRLWDRDESSNFQLSFRKEINLLLDNSSAYWSHLCENWN
jgi:hypothetical protein